MPKMPWIGPSCAMLPWMPRNRNGMSSRMPASTSTPSEIDSSTRITSPSARAVCRVSRTWPIVTARKASPAVDTQLQNEPAGSWLQNTLTSAHATKSTRVVGTSRTSEISRRREIRIPIPMTHSPTMIETYVTRPAIFSIAYEEKTAPRTAIV